MISLLSSSKSKLGTKIASCPVSGLFNYNRSSSFWISWVNGTIQVGKGVQVGQNPFMTYADFTPSTVNRMSVTTANNVTGTWVIPGVYYLNGTYWQSCLLFCCIQQLNSVTMVTLDNCVLSNSRRGNTQSNLVFTIHFCKINILFRHCRVLNRSYNMTNKTNSKL